MPPEEKSGGEPLLKQIRTYQGDVAEALKRQKESLVSIQRTEEMRRSTSDNKEARLTAEESKRRRDIFFLILGSIVLFTIGGGGAWYAYHGFIASSTTPLPDEPENRFVTVNSENILDISSINGRDELVSKLASATENTPERELRQVNLKKNNLVGKQELVPVEEFLAILRTRAPSSLVRSFEPYFMYGSLGKSNFIIIKLNSFENAFAGMLSWEKSMAEDIGPIFATVSLLRESDSSNVFVDMTDKNKDLRVLEVGGRTFLLYSFLENKTLIITDNIETLRFLINRLTLEKLSH